MCTNKKLSCSGFFRRGSTFLALAVIFTFSLAFMVQPTFAIDSNTIWEFDAEDTGGTFGDNPVRDNLSLVCNGGANLGLACTINADCPDGACVVGSPSADWYTILEGNDLDVGVTQATYCEEPTGAGDGKGGKDQSPTVYSGSNKDIDDIDTWEWNKIGNAPDKNDLVNGISKVYTCGPSEEHCDAGDTIIVFGATLFDGTGSHNFGFWFGQDEWNITGGFGGGDTCDTNDESGSFTGNHIKDDILMVVEWNGNEFKELNIFLWDDQVFKNLKQVTGNLSPVIFRECGLVNGDDDACVMTNKENSFTIDDSQFTYESKFGPSDGTYPNKQTVTPGSFFEGFLNLTSTFNKLGLDEPCISSYLINTRTSTSNTAALKDWMFGDLNICEVDVNKSCRVTGTVIGGDAKFEGTADITFTNVGPGGFSDGVLEITDALNDVSLGATVLGFVEADNSLSGVPIQLTLDEAPVGDFEIAPLAAGDTVTFCDDLTCVGEDALPGECEDFITDRGTACGEFDNGICTPDCTRSAIRFLTNLNPPLNTATAKLCEDSSCLPAEVIVEAKTVVYPNPLANEDVRCKPIPVSPMLHAEKVCETFLNLAGDMVKVNVEEHGLVCNTGDVPMGKVVITDTRGIGSLEETVALAMPALGVGVECFGNDGDCANQDLCVGGTCSQTGIACTSPENSPVGCRNGDEDYGCESFDSLTQYCFPALCLGGAFDGDECAVDAECGTNLVCSTDNTEAPCVSLDAGDTCDTDGFCFAPTCQDDMGDMLCGDLVAGATCEEDPESAGNYRCEKDSSAAIISRNMCLYDNSACYVISGTYAPKAPDAVYECNGGFNNGETCNPDNVNADCEHAEGNGTCDEVFTTVPHDAMFTDTFTATATAGANNPFLNRDAETTATYTCPLCPPLVTPK